MNVSFGALGSLFSGLDLVVSEEVNLDVTDWNNDHVAVEQHPVQPSENII